MLHRRNADRIVRAGGILFDLDNTLYPADRGIFTMINERIDRFVAIACDADLSDVKGIRKRYIGEYGTTLRGLIKHQGVSPDFFLEFVHDVPVEEILKPDEQLREFIGRIDLPKVIFTNASAMHARKVLGALGIGDLFDGICDFADTGFLGKPHHEAYSIAAGMMGVDLDRSIFVDDMERNIAAAACLRLFTVHVGGSGENHADIAVEKLVDLSAFFSKAPWYRSPRVRRT